jgi:hypothetical protein
MKTLTTTDNKFFEGALHIAQWKRLSSGSMDYGYRVTNKLTGSQFDYRLTIDALALQLGYDAIELVAQAAADLAREVRS